MSCLTNQDCKEHGLVAVADILDRSYVTDGVDTIPPSYAQREQAEESCQCHCDGTVHIETAVLYTSQLAQTD